MEQDNGKTQKIIEAYDAEAEATGWFGPEVAFGLIYKYIHPDQSVLDIGIGTGLGSILFKKVGLTVYGMDISQEMLDACRFKGFRNLKQHDFTNPPYPYATRSFDIVVCTGALNFFKDLSSVFDGSAGVLRPEGIFAFVVGDRAEHEAMETIVGPEHTKCGESVTMYRHSARQIESWADENGFMLLRSLPFTVFMDYERKHSMPAKAYLVQKTG